MTENNLLQNLFKVGLSREQFIDKYMELRQAETNEDFSIFTSDITLAAGEIYDSLNTNGNEILDEQEINSLLNFDNTDGETILSEADMTELYNKTINNITKYSKSDTPEKMYTKAVLSGGKSQDEYLKNITVQIDLLDMLIKAAQSNSELKINGYQAQINDLILRSTKLSTDFKNSYQKTSSEISKLKKEASDYEQKIRQKENEIQEKQTEIKLINAEIKALDEKKDSDKIETKKEEINSLSADITRLENEYSAISQKCSITLSKISQKQDILNKLSAEAKSEDFSLNEKIDALNTKIAQEQDKSDINISNYKFQSDNLKAASEYTAAQIIQPSGANQTTQDITNTNLSRTAAELKSKWSAAVPWLSDGFYNKAIEVSQHIGCEPDALLGLMYSESGLKSDAVNKNGGATGLIQFMPQTAKLLGTSTSAIKQMSAEEQLDYVEEYFSRTKKTAHISSSDKIDAGTLYALVFLPAYAKRDVLAVSGTKYYNYNSGLDANRDGQITKTELSNRVMSFVPKG